MCHLHFAKLKQKGARDVDLSLVRRFFRSD